MSEINHIWRFVDYLKIIPAILVGIIIFYFSSLSNPYPTPLPEQIAIPLNALMHLCEYGLFSFLLFFGFFPRIKPFYLLTISFIYAFLDEIHQYFVPYRYFDVFDLVLDFIGGILGFISYLLAEKLFKNIKRKQKSDEF